MNLASVAASFFEKFSAGAAAPGDVVYFYRPHEVATPGSGALVIVGDQGTLVGRSRDEERDERLWILLDASGVVKACVHERDEPPPPEEPPAPRPGEETA